MEHPGLLPLWYFAVLATVFTVLIGWFWYRLTNPSEAELERRRRYRASLQGQLEWLVDASPEQVAKWQRRKRLERERADRAAAAGAAAAAAGGGCAGGGCG